jgi:adenine-specific DNA-methyltransferase
MAKQKKDGNWNIYEKYRKATFKAKTIWDEKGMISEQGTLDLKDLDLKGFFDFPKPVALIKKAMSIGTDEESIILDFFAGSGTTAQAAMELNAADSGDRKFVLVQMPEECKDQSNAKEAGFRTIADICKERIRRASNRTGRKGESQNQGFSVFRLTASTFRIWQDYNGTNLVELESKLDLFESPLIDGWKPENLLIEILLLEGFALDSKIEKLKNHRKNTVHHVSSDSCEHKLLVCLDAKIHEETVKALEFQENDVFVCLDSALTDQGKMRLADVCRLKTI